MKYVAFCALLAVPALALAAEMNPDSRFYTAAAEGGMGEVQLARLAQEKSSDPKVKDFAAMMIKDHSAANEELQSLASGKNIKLPSGAGMRADATRLKLEALSGATFDKSYIRNQVTAHRQTVALLKQEIGSGHDADAQAFARKILPTVQGHLKAIEALAGADGVKR